MKKQLAIIQLKEKTTLLGRSEETIQELREQVACIPALQDRVQELLRTLGERTDLLHEAQRKLDAIKGVLA